MGVGRQPTGERGIALLLTPILARFEAPSDRPASTNVAKLVMKARHVNSERPASSKQRICSRARVHQILISQSGGLATTIDAPMADPIIDGSMEFPVLRAEKERDLFRALH